MGKNVKKRNDDRRGWQSMDLATRNKFLESSRLRAIEHPELQDKEWLVSNYINLKKTTQQIAREIGCVPSTVYFALLRLEIPKRGRKEARKGIKFSKSHLENIASANRLLEKIRSGSAHWNWQGGKTSIYEKRVAILKRSPEYKQWRRIVRSAGFCRVCGSVEHLEAHHILPKYKYPQLMFDITNGMCLCRNCHVNLHLNVNGMNSGNPKNPEPSRVETRKVQRLLEEGTPSLITS